MYNYSCTQVTKFATLVESTMAPYQCFYDECEFKTADLSDETIMNQHLYTHMQIKHGYIQGSSQNQQPDKTEKLKKPTINMGCTLEDWTFFISEWVDYKKLGKPSTSDLSRILIQCCEIDLRRHLHRSYGSLGEKSEEDVLEIIKQHAVQIENIVVSRVSLLEMKQDRDEPVRNYVARLKGQASICNYTIKFKPDCGCNKEYDVNYMEEQVRDVLAHGLADNEIRIDILSDVNQDMNLDTVVQLIEAKEVGKKSASQLSNTHKISAVKSSYKRESRQFQPGYYQNFKNENKLNNSVKYKTKFPSYCSYCGNQGHSRSYETRKMHCPAFNHTCKECNIRHHYEKVCREKLNKPSYPSNTSTLYSDYYDNTFELKDQVGVIHQSSTKNQD